MTQQDRDYILLICKRLVYRYKENPEIINAVEKILHQNEQELSFYRDSHKHIDRFIDVTINNLSEIKNYSISQQPKKERIPTVVPPDDLFEDINFNNLFINNEQ